ncbi:hypothetical protein EDB81DRAFT_759550 [Dactylonectria macrodidyma]|uniref:Uncharacterized protein n=1 Tax=Dactylonectria macrodidyma TaxID=307937 RepID=A0A9P9EVV5_9HYPO|nr:hypothetical protein EDB81DRAFT_759550 [Dactylonectria macrodidyma]
MADTLPPPHINREGEYQPPAFYCDGSLIPTEYPESAVKIIKWYSRSTRFCMLESHGRVGDQAGLVRCRKGLGTRHLLRDQTGHQDKVDSPMTHQASCPTFTQKPCICAKNFSHREDKCKRPHNQTFNRKRVYQTYSFSCGPSSASFGGHLVRLVDHAGEGGFVLTVSERDVDESALRSST